MSDNDPGRDDLAGDQAAPSTSADDTATDPRASGQKDTSPTAGVVFDETRLRGTTPAEAPAETPPDSAESAPEPEEAASGDAGSVNVTRADGPTDDTSAASGQDTSEAAEAETRQDRAKDAPAPEDGEKGAADGGGKRPRRVLRRVAFGLVVVMLLGGAGAAWLYHDLVGGIRTKHVTDQLGADRPKKLNKSLNILLIGSDTREGDNAEYGGSAEFAGARSDTAILLHLSPNRDQAVGISFPRDSMVKIPACEKEKGGTVPGRFGMLNSAFAFAGPTCTWKMLESLTGIHIDHFVQVDFSGFKRMVDALGGVEICVDKPVNDPRAELYLKAGKQTVKGEQALGYVRARYSLGNGSDLERIERQQKFMAAVVDKATSGKVLTDPAKTYKFLKAATKSVTTDDELDLSAMRKLADGLKGMSAGQVRFVTVPVERYAPDPNRVQWNQELAKPLFDAVRHDNDLPAEPAEPVKAKQAPPAPGKVNVTVVAAGGRDQLVKRVVKQLRQRGFKVAKKVEKGAAAPESRIVFAPSAEAQASALARDVPDALLTPDAAAPANGVRLVIGRNGLRLAPPTIHKIGGGVKGGEKLCG
ncbi:LytR family transcriptional regulator [Actinomadura sp. KC06]|uniref:LCP family protein n=1 Tax=Actinomadura sp. KC06 TaxID=2530369 RepID=UPI0010486168|nr:LCP family protein [Actinomadura sp. KC06]TDD33805.1 LytR family transcriptional regulator [Actinomadura sp. KC06]